MGGWREGCDWAIGVFGQIWRCLLRWLSHPLNPVFLRKQIAHVKMPPQNYDDMYPWTFLSGCTEILELSKWAYSVYMFPFNNLLPSHYITH